MARKQKHLRVNRWMFTTGLVLLAAAIAGGGLSSQGITVPVIDDLGRQIALGFVGALLLALSPFVTFDSAPDPQIGGESGDAAAVVRLPHPQVPFVSRVDRSGEDFVARLRAEVGALEQPIVIWGAGGVGKTSLATQTGREWARETRGQVIYIDAQALDQASVEVILDELALQVGLKPRHAEEAREKEARCRRALAERAILLILDTFELVPPESQSDTLALIRRLPCRTLVASRERLGEGSRNIAVDPMNPDEARQFVQALTQTGQDPNLATKLPIDRVVLTSEGNPQIIEWLVAQVDLGAEPDLLLARLEEGHGSIAEEVFGRSIAMPQVTDDDRALLKALCLFVPDASRQALGHVAGFDEDMPTEEASVTRLSSLRLLENSADGSRIQIRGLTRQMVRAKLLDDPTSGDYLKRFVEFFHTFAESGEPTPMAKDGKEFSNLLTAIRLAAEIGEAKAAAHIYIQMSDVLLARGYWAEIDDLGRIALDQARRAGLTSDVADIATRLGQLSLERHQLQTARGFLTEARQVAEESTNAWAYAASTRGLGWLAVLEGDPTSAEGLLQQSIMLDRERGDLQATAVGLDLLGRLKRDSGELEEAQDLLEESLKLEHQLGNSQGMAAALHQLGTVKHDQGRIEEAESMYLQSLEIEKSEGNRPGEMSALFELASLMMQRDDHSRAREFFEAGIPIAEELGALRELSRALDGLAYIALTNGDEELASQLAEQSKANKAYLGET